MRSLIILLLCVPVLTTGLAYAGGASHISIVPGAMSAMSAEDRITVVITALEWRDEQLQNFSYDLVETMGRINLVDGTRAILLRSDIRLKRLKENIWFECQRYEVTGDLRSDFRISWDGSRELSLTLPSERSGGRGNIRDSELPIVREVGYNQMLGLRMIEGPETLVQWLTRNLSAARVSIDIRVETIEGQELIAVSVTRGSNRTFWLDPARHYMPVRFSYSDGGNHELHWMTDAEQIDGLWVPLRVVRRSGTKASPGFEGEFIYEITDFTRGDVREQDFELVFPPGMHVVDSIRKVAFKLDEQGREELLPLYDSQTGQVTVGGQPSDGLPAAIDTGRVARETPSSAAGLRFVVILGAAIMLVAGIILLLRSKRRLT